MSISKKPQATIRVVRQGYHIVNGIWRRVIRRHLIEYHLDTKSKRMNVDFLHDLDNGQFILTLERLPESLNGRKRQTRSQLDLYTIVEVTDPLLCGPGWELIGQRGCKYGCVLYFAKLPPSYVPGEFFEIKKGKRRVR